MKTSSPSRPGYNTKCPMYFAPHPDQIGVVTRRYSLSLHPRTGKLVSFGCDLYDGFYFLRNLLVQGAGPGASTADLALQKHPLNYEEAEIRPADGQHPHWKFGPTKWRCATGQREFEFAIDANLTLPSVWGNWIAPWRHKLPVYLHLPDHGLWRITGTKDAELQIEIDWTRLHYRFRFTSPSPLEIEAEALDYFPLTKTQSRWAEHFGVRQGWLGAFATYPGTYAIANASAGCNLGSHLYNAAQMAAVSQPLPGGLHLMEVVRSSVDFHLNLNQAAGTNPHAESYWLDSAGSLLVAANCVARHPSTPKDWLSQRWPLLVKLAEACLNRDADGDGILESWGTGNDGNCEFPEYLIDNVSAGWKISPINAVAYRGLRCMAEMAEQVGAAPDAWQTAAGILKSRFKDAFLNPRTGVLAGWRSQDGKLHDHYYMWGNTLALAEGLLDKPDAKKVVRRILAKMKAVGYSRYDFGIPCNLVPVPADQYHGDMGAGGEKGFQEFCNGGAIYVYAPSWVWALRSVGLHQEADRVIAEMLPQFAAGKVHRSGPEWPHYGVCFRSWDGRTGGMECYLTWSFFGLLACVESPFAEQIAKAKALRPPTAYSPVTGVPAGAVQGTALARTGVVAATKIDRRFLDRPVVVATARSLTFNQNVEIPGEYEIEVGGIVGGEFGGCRLVVDGRPLWSIRPANGQAQFRKLGSRILKAGAHVLTYEGRQGRKLGWEYVRLRPRFTDVRSDKWMMLGPLGADSVAHTNQAFLETHPVEEETVADFSKRYVDQFTGRQLKWSVPRFSHELVDFKEMYGVGHTLGVQFAVTHIRAPAERQARLSLGLDYFAKVWVNREKILEVGHTTKRNDRGGHLRGAFECDVTLRPGWNEVLVKLQSGLTNNGFWFAITDPCDLLIHPKRSSK